MANSTPPPPPPRQNPRHSWLVRVISLVLLALIVLAGLVVLIIWLAIKPRRLVYSIEEGTIHNFNLTNNHLNANYNFLLRAYNPNGKVSIYYDKVETTVLYDGQTIAVGTLNPFFQPRRNVTHLKFSLQSQNITLFGSVDRDLWLEKSSGEVELDVKVKAKIRFKVGIWKSRRRTLRILCAPVMAHFSSSKVFQRTICEVDL